MAAHPRSRPSLRLVSSWLRRVCVFGMALSGVAIVACAQPSAHARPARADGIALQLDARLQDQVTRRVGTRAGTVIVYDAPTKRVLVVTNPTVAFATLRPPGSLMKLAAALALYPDRARRVQCRDRIDVGGRVLTCGAEGGHGFVDLRAAIARSCCIWFHAGRDDLTPASLLAAARRLGLGRASPFPAGCAARVRVPAGAAERALTAVGEGPFVVITPWDAVMMTASLRDARDEAGRFVFDAMRDAVTEGTACGASRAGVEVHGKTGTALWLGPRHGDGPPRTHGWFTGTAGRLVVAVFLQRGTGRDAAVLAGEVLDLCRARI